jgi:hypothetical protein
MSAALIVRTNLSAPCCILIRSKNLIALGGARAVHYKSVARPFASRGPMLSAKIRFVVRA